jgi:hypothetical protein
MIQTSFRHHLETLIPDASPAALTIEVAHNLGGSLWISDPEFSLLPKGGKDIAQNRDQLLLIDGEDQRKINLAISQ